MDWKTTRKSLLYSLGLDISLLVDQIKKNEGEGTAIIMAMHFSGWNIADICKEQEVSRFKVNLRLKKGVKHVKQLLAEEEVKWVLPKKEL